VLSKKGLLLRPLEVSKYFEKPPDERLESPNFQFDVFEPPHVRLFTDKELSSLDEATKNYRINAQNSNIEAQKKELMRFIVEFSWKTSQIEGNTYDLISTERLLLYGEKSSSNTEFEAQMILNQKKAIDFILENIDIWESPRISSLEALHAIVGEKLDISKILGKLWWVLQALITVRSKMKSKYERL